MRVPLRVPLAFAAAFSALGSRPVAAQPAADTLLSLAHYFDLEQVGNPQISPDGKTIVYTRGWVDKVNDRWDNAIWVMNADGTKNRYLTKGSNPVWSPDGTRIAYLAAAEEPKGTPSTVCSPCGGRVAHHGIGAEVKHIAISTRTDYHRVRGVTLYLSGQQIAHDDASAFAVYGHHIEHFMAIVEFYRP